MEGIDEKYITNCLDKKSILWYLLENYPLTNEEIDLICKLYEQKMYSESSNIIVFLMNGVNQSYVFCNSIPEDDKNKRMMAILEKNKELIKKIESELKELNPL